MKTELKIVSYIKQLKALNPSYTNEDLFDTLVRCGEIEDDGVKDKACYIQCLLDGLRPVKPTYYDCTQNATGKASISELGKHVLDKKGASETDFTSLPYFRELTTDEVIARDEEARKKEQKRIDDRAKLIKDLEEKGAILKDKDIIHVSTILN